MGVPSMLVAKGGTASALLDHKVEYDGADTEVTVLVSSRASFDVPGRECVFAVCLDDEHRTLQIRVRGFAGGQLESAPIRLTRPLADGHLLSKKRIDSDGSWALTFALMRTDWTAWQ